MLCSTPLSYWVLFLAVHCIVVTPEMMNYGYYLRAWTCASHTRPIPSWIPLCQSNWGCNWSCWTCNGVLLLFFNGWTDISALIIIISHILTNPLGHCNIIIGVLVVIIVYNVYLQWCEIEFQFWIVWDFLRWLVGSAFLTSSLLIVLFDPYYGYIQMDVLCLFWHY